MVDQVALQKQYDSVHAMFTLYSRKNCVYGSVFVCVSVYMYISMFVCVRLSKHLKDQLGPPLSDEKCLSVKYLFIPNDIFVYLQQRICLFTTTS